MIRSRGIYIDEANADVMEPHSSGAHYSYISHLHKPSDQHKPCLRHTGERRIKGVKEEDGNTGYVDTCGKRLQGNVCVVFLAAVPLAFCLAITALHIFRTTQAWRAAEESQLHIQKQLMHLGMLIIDLSTEREIMALLLTNPEEITRDAYIKELELARKRTDESLANIRTWPGQATDGAQYQTTSSFKSYLGNHRETSSPDGHFQRELQFYTEIVDTILRWCSVNIKDLPSKEPTTAWRWLVSFNHFLSVVNPMGVEQALCSVYRSVVCFSRSETLYFANASFSAEAAFRLYRDSYPIARQPPGWKDTIRSEFFPDLSSCRDGILADMDYTGPSLDRELCAISRRNDSRYDDLTPFIAQEYELLTSNLSKWWQQNHNAHAYSLFTAGAFTGLFLTYIITMIFVQLFCKIKQDARKKKRQKTQHIGSREELNLSLEGKYEQLAPMHPTAFLRQAGHHNVSSTTIHSAPHNGSTSVMKVATV